MLGFELMTVFEMSVVETDAGEDQRAPRRVWAPGAAASWVSADAADVAGCGASAGAAAHGRVRRYPAVRYSGQVGEQKGPLTAVSADALPVSGNPLGRLVRRHQHSGSGWRAVNQPQPVRFVVRTEQPVARAEYERVDHQQ